MRLTLALQPRSPPKTHETTLFKFKTGYFQKEQLHWEVVGQIRIINLFVVPITKKEFPLLSAQFQNGFEYCVSRRGIN